MRHARDIRMPTASNTQALVEVPRDRSKEIQPLTPEQSRTLLHAAKGLRLGALVSVSTALGLRLGEALGLAWDDVDIDGGVLCVRQALERSGGDSAARRSLIEKRRVIRKRPLETPNRSEQRRKVRQELEAVRKQWRFSADDLELTEPKSVRSRRTVRMPQLTALKAHRKAQLEEWFAAGGEWEYSGLVFTTPIGTALDPRNVTREFQAMLVAAEVPRVRFHGLRHTAAKLLLAQGVAPQTMMETLGHSQISLTLKPTYCQRCRNPLRRK